MDNANRKEINKVYLQTSQCPIEVVTVFNDRAEVTRLVAAEVVDTTEIIVKGLPKSVKSDSIHVSGGKGEAVILEVSYSLVYDEKKKDEEREKLLLELEELKEKQQEHNTTLSRVQKEKELLSQYGNTVTSSNNAKEGQGNAIEKLVAESTLSGFENFLKFYTSHSEKLDLEIKKVNKEIKLLGEKVKNLNTQISLTSGSKSDNESRQVSISVHAEKTVKITLKLTYIVSQASWDPSYDVRVTTAKTKEEKNNAELTYYGSVQQNTGEDWKDVQLFLSTAEPASAKEIPTLETKYLRHTAPIMTRNYVANYKMEEEVQEKSIRRRADSSMALPDLRSLDKSLEVQTMTTKVKKSVTNSNFEIPRRATVDSDNKPHKVTIVKLDMPPTLEYICIPQVSPRVFLKASVVNNSEYGLLLGPANIFLDNDFVATSELQFSTTTHALEFSLGVDGGIGVTYSPPNSFSENRGMIKKMKDRRIEYNIKLINTKKLDVTVNVLHQLPLSKEETIKVKLIEPDLSKPNAPKLNEQNNIEWKVNIKGQTSLDIPLKYSVEWPADKSIEGLDY